MHYSSAAGFLLSGIVLSVLGPLLAWVTLFAAMFRPLTEQFTFGVVWVAIGLSLVGFALLFIGIRRADED